MNKKTKEELQALVDQATSGDKKALETLVAQVQDMVFSLSLRMPCICRGCGPGHFVENDYPPFLFPGRQRIYNMGILHCRESSEKLQKAYVCPLSVKF